MIWHKSVNKYKKKHGKGPGQRLNALCSASPASGNWSEKEWRLQFSYIVISCQKELIVQFPCAPDSCGQRIGLTLKISACHVFCVTPWYCAHQGVKASSYLHWEISQKISFYKKEKVHMFYQSPILSIQQWCSTYLARKSKLSWILLPGKTTEAVSIIGFS